MTMVTDAEVILTKNSVMAKMRAMLNELGGLYELEWQECNAGWTVKDKDGSILGPGDPKVSKGENYKGMPYLILDYPRLFTKEDVFAIRTMFYWGHYFTITFHLKGYYRDLFLPVISKYINMFISHDFYVGISPDEWRHDFSDGNYLNLINKTQPEIDTYLKAHPHLKFCAKVDFDKIALAPKVLQLLFRVIVNILPYKMNMGA